MRRSKAAKAIEIIAVREGISIAEVRNKMQEAINLAFENREQDAATKAFWGKWGGRKPSPEEFINATTKKTLAILDFNKLMKQ